MTDSPDTFDWAKEDSIVLRDQPAVAICSNRFQQVVVIRCERAWDQEDDVFVLVDFAHAIRVAHAILVAAGQDDIQFYRQTGRGCQDVEIELPPNWNPEEAEHALGPIDLKPLVLRRGSGFTPSANHRRASRATILG
jgi:hypothetical protein